MVGVNNFAQLICTVAVCATLSLAIHGGKLKIVLFQLENDNINLGCENTENLWNINESTKTKYLILEPEKEGCLRTKNAVTLNSSAPITLKFFQDNVEDNGKVIVTLVPVEGTCKDEECVWDVANDPEFKKGAWVAIEHKFPLKTVNEFYISLHVENNKGKFMVENIAAPGPELNFDLPYMVNGVDHLIGVAANETNKSSIAPCMAEFSKNLMITSASVLTLNHLLN